MDRKGKERMGIAWLKAGIWKLRGIRRGFERGHFLQCVRKEVAKRILLQWSEMKKWREELYAVNRCIQMRT
jgi:hypothetical protein